MDTLGGQNPNEERPETTEETEAVGSPAGGWLPPPQWGPAAWTPPGGSYGDPGGGYANYGHGYGYGGHGFSANPTPPPAEPTGRRRRRSRAIAAGSIAAAVILAGVAGGVVGHSMDSQAAAGGTSTGAGSTQVPSTSPGYGSSPFGGGSGGATVPGYPGGVGGAGTGGLGSNASGSTGSTTGSGPSDSATIASKVDPGLVDIDTVVDYGEAEAAGTGMVLTSSGEILTNNHVIDGATSIKVTDVGNGRTYSAKVVGYDLTQDVAVIQLENASGLKTVSTAQTSVASGDKVVAIGNAGGKGGTPSYAGGTVTSTSRSITASDEMTGNSERLNDLIATNADIQAGDSGGPLVNTSGQVVGMDTAGSGGDELTSASAEGFAIPISEATSLARQIEASEASSTVHVGTTAFLGVELSSASSGSSGYGGDPFGSPYSGGSTSTSGVEISGTVSGGPAAEAGLAAGDTITSVAGHAVSSDDTLQQVMVNDLRPGQTVGLTYTNSSGSHSVQVTVSSGPPA